MNDIREMYAGDVINGYNDGIFDLTQVITKRIMEYVNSGRTMHSSECWRAIKNGTILVRVIRKSDFIYRIALQVPLNETHITAGDLASSFGSIASAIGFASFIEAAWCDDQQIGYLEVVDGDLVCAMDFEFRKV